jgi:hypothetical protein
MGADRERMIGLLDTFDVGGKESGHLLGFRKTHQATRCLIKSVNQESFAIEVLVKQLVYTCLLDA